MEQKKSILILLYLCGSMTVAMFSLGIFGQLFSGLLVWDFSGPFPFEFKEVFLVLIISLAGFPAGFVLWFFVYRNL